MYTQNEIMFPHAVIQDLAETRGPEWQALVTHIQALPQSHENTLAFMLLMIKLNGCMECETDSYRAMRGCDQCALQTLRRFKSSDSNLIAQYEEALLEIRERMQSAPILALLQEKDFV